MLREDKSDETRFLPDPGWLGLRWRLHIAGEYRSRQTWTKKKFFAFHERQPARRSGDFDALGPGEVQLLAAAAADEQDAAIFTAAALTGLRLGELRALRWRDVDFAKRLVHVRKSYTYGNEGMPKSGGVRSVPLIDQAARALDGLSRREHFTAPDDLVFVNSVGGVVDDSKLRRRYYVALERAGLRRLTFHSLRHSFGTLAVQAFPLSDVRALWATATSARR